MSNNLIDPRGGSNAIIVIIVLTLTLAIFYMNYNIRSQLEDKDNPIQTATAHLTAPEPASPVPAQALPEPVAVQPTPSEPPQNKGNDSSADTQSEKEIIYELPLKDVILVQ